MCEKNIRFCILRTLSLGLRPSLSHPSKKFARRAKAKASRRTRASHIGHRCRIRTFAAKTANAPIKKTLARANAAETREIKSHQVRELAVLSTAARTRSCSLRSPSCAPFFGSGRDRPRPGSSRGHVRAGGGHAAGRATAHATRRSGRCRRRRRTGCCRHRDTAELVAEQEDGSARRRCTGPSPCTPVSWRV